MFKEQLSEKHIDEISFLELVKDLTPMVRRKAEIAVEPITKMIDFENDDSDIEEEAHFED